jgi:ADP-ribose pyrophosphatase
MKQPGPGTHTEAPSDVPAHWETVESRYGPPMPLFRPRIDTVRHPRTRRLFERIVLETADWVNVVAVTEDGQLVLVRQYRFGSGELSLEVPGGVVDPEEDPQEAARRELLEETGYASDSWRLLARVRPNPAFLGNSCHQFLAERARVVSQPHLESGEDIAVQLASPSAVADMVRTGAIDHSLVVSALCRAIDLCSR